MYGLTDYDYGKSAGGLAGLTANNYVGTPPSANTNNQVGGTIDRGAGFKDVNYPSVWGGPTQDMMMQEALRRNLHLTGAGVSRGEGGSVFDLGNGTFAYQAADGSYTTVPYAKGWQSGSLQDPNALTPGSGGGSGNNGLGWGDVTYPRPETSGTRTPYEYGVTGMDMESLQKFYTDQIFGNMGLGQQALDGMINNYETANGLLGGAYTDKYNGYNQLLDELNAKLNAGYADMQSYMPGAQSAADAANSNLGTLAPLLADMQNAYYDQGRDMEAMRLAYNDVKSGTIPVELENKLNQIYDMQMAQGTTALNDSYDRSLSKLMDSLGGRGILSSTTSGMAQTGLNANLMKELQNMEYDYGTQKLQEMIEAPYRIFDASTQLYNASGQRVSAAGDILNGGLGIQNMYNQNADNYLGLANQANSNYAQLINSANSQAQYGRSSLDALMNQINAYGQQAGIGSGIYNDIMGPAQNLWNSLLGAETARLTSGQASSGESGGGEWWHGPAADLAGDLLGGLFG
jgi:hypothetical protein